MYHPYISIDSLEKYGDPIVSIAPSEGGQKTFIHFVKYGPWIIGLGSFHGISNQCVIAMLFDQDGVDIMLGKFNGGYPITEIELDEIRKIFNSAFR